MPLPTSATIETNPTPHPPAICRLITAEDIKSAGIIRTLSADDIEPLRRLLVKDMPDLSSGTTPVKLEDADYQDLAAMLARQLVRISQPPTIRGCESQGVKFLRMDTRCFGEVVDFTLAKRIQSKWEEIEVMRTRH